VESRLAAECIKVEFESLEANRPAHAITEYAQKNGMDMIVITTHCYTGMEGMMMGEWQNSGEECKIPFRGEAINKGERDENQSGSVD
jgi:hypothetical protein